LRTKKHFTNVEINSTNSTKVQKSSKKRGKRGEKYRICDFCCNNIHKSNKARHIQTCKKKKEADMQDIIDKLLKDKEELHKDKDNINNDYIESLKKQIDKQSTISSNIINSNNTNSNNKIHYNISYIINNYTDAHNYEDLMAPTLTKEEKKYIREKGPAVGREKLIEDRCLTNIKKEKRPFHCVDYSRRKFAVRTNDEWVTDIDGKIVLDEPSKKVRKIFNKLDTNIDYNRQADNTHQLITMEHLGKKTMKNLGKLTLIKGDIV
jgi:hypothetical protein